MSDRDLSEALEEITIPPDPAPGRQQSAKVPEESRNEDEFLLSPNPANPDQVNEINSQDDTKVKRPAVHSPPHAESGVAPLVS